MKRTNQRGESAIGIVIGMLFAFTLIAFIFWALKDRPQTSHRARPKQAQVQGEFLASKDGKHGTYAYRDDSGFWWYYIFVLNSNSTAASNGSYSYAPPSSLPSGGTWSKGDQQAPVEDEVVSQATETIDEAAAGEPITSEEFEVENQAVEPENNTEISEPSSEPSGGSESTPADSGSSDTGGDSGGGDGGGSPD